jgi:hypothetical protein
MMILFLLEKLCDAFIGLAELPVKKIAGFVVRQAHIMRTLN